MSPATVPEQFRGHTCIPLGWMLWRIGTFRPWTALFFPLPLTFFALVMLRSLVLSHLLGRVTWRGRQIQTVQSKEEPGAGAQKGQERQPGAVVVARRKRSAEELWGLPEELEEKSKGE